MKNEEIIKKLGIIKENALRLYEDAAALEEELSGSSDGSIPKTVLSREQIKNIIATRDKSRFKK